MTKTKRHARHKNIPVSKNMLKGVWIFTDKNVSVLKIQVKGYVIKKILICTLLKWQLEFGNIKDKTLLHIQHKLMCLK